MWTATDAEIRRRVGAARFERGLGYARSGAVSGGSVRAGRVAGLCRGSQARPYEVWARLGERAIEAAGCTCPTGQGGRCKHVAALLLSLRMHPARFVLLPSDELSLASKGRDELAAIVGQCIELHPELAWLIEGGGVGLCTGAQARERAEQAVSRATSGQSTPAWARDVLARLIAPARRPRDEQRAAAVAVLVEVARVLCNAMHETTSLEGAEAILMRAVSWLGNLCADMHTPEAARGEGLSLLCELVGALAGAAPLVADEASSALGQAVEVDVEAVVARLRAAVAAAEGEGARALSRALLEAGRQRLGDAEIAAICGRAGLVVEGVELLLSRGQRALAVGLSRRAGDGVAVPLAGALLRHGLPTEARRVIDEAAARDEAEALDWLRDERERRRDLAAARGLALRAMRAAPTLSRFRHLARLEPDPTRREALLPALSLWLCEQGQGRLSVEIMLETGRPIEALEALGHVPFEASLFLRVARRLEPERPHASIALYKRIIDELAKTRSREGYHLLALAAKSVERLSRALGEEASFHDYLAQLASLHRGLPALLDELGARGLRVVAGEATVSPAA